MSAWLDAPDGRPFQGQGPDAAGTRGWAALLLRAIGWRIDCEAPAQDKYVLAGAPHTSNWDFPVFLLFCWYYKLEVRWLAKQSLFKPGVGWLLRALGGIAVDRAAPHGLVEELAKLFKDSERLVLAIPVEGTRSKAPHWKSGFYNIAMAAGVPVYLGYLDFEKRRGGIGPALLPEGARAQDMDRIREFYADIRGLKPENQGPVRLRDESPLNGQRR